MHEHHGAVTALTIEHLAGHPRFEWNSIHPTLNVLVGRNGVGKSTVLQSLVAALDFTHGRRTEDLITGAFPNASINLAFASGERFALTLEEIRKNQPPKGTKPSRNVLYYVENRRPKSRVGRNRNDLLQHVSVRYEFAANELKHLLGGDDGEQALAQALLQDLRTLGVVTPVEEQEISNALRAAGPKTSRPLSCGQFDALAMLLDLRRLAARSAPAPYVVLDNPDAFLHPSAHHLLLSLVRRHLPEAQVFVASHSLKLIARTSPRSLFWLPHPDPAASPTVAHCVRDLREGARDAFFELYATDASSALLEVVLGLESSDYSTFLLECALPCRSIERASPGQDRQLQLVSDLLPAGSDPWYVLDVGSGAGDLLEALVQNPMAGFHVRYVASQSAAEAPLTARLASALEHGAVAPTSAIVSSVEDAPVDADAVVLCNVCHAVNVDELGALLAKCVHLLRQLPSSRVVIVEARVLRVGERDFVLWRPSDFAWAFETVDGVHVRDVSPASPDGVPLDATIITRDPATVLSAELGTVLASRLCARLPTLLSELIAERDEERSLRCPAGIEEARRQRRLACLSEQVSNVAALIVRNDGELVDNSSVNEPDGPASSSWNSGSRDPA